HSYSPVAFNACEQMPQGKRISIASLAHHRGESIIAAAFEVKSLERANEVITRVFEVRSPHPDSESRLAHRVSRNVHLAPVTHERNPSQRHVKQAAARIVYFKRVHTPEVNRFGGGSVHKEQAGRRGDSRLHSPMVKREPVFVRLRLDQADARVGI